MRVIKVAEHRKTVIGKIGLQLEYISVLFQIATYIASKASSRLDRATSKITRVFMTKGILLVALSALHFFMSYSC